MEAKNTLSHQAVNIALLLLIAFIWASAFGAMKVAAPETGPITLAAMRSSIAAVILLCLLRLRGPIEWHIGVKYFPQFLVIGGLGSALPFMMLPWAELHIESSLAGLLMSVGPLATLAGAWLFRLEDNIPKSRIFGIIIGLCGALLIFADGFGMMGTSSIDTSGMATSSMGTSGMGHIYLVAQIVAVLASLCYVCGNLMVRRISFIPPLTISTLAITLSALLLWPFALIIEAPAPSEWSGPAWQMVLWLGIMPTAFAFSVRYYLIARAGASFTSYVGYLIPGIAVLIGAIALGEAVTSDKLAALGLILIGLILAQKPASSAKKP